MFENPIEIPKTGVSREALLAEIAQRRGNDTQWKDGKAFCLVYYPGDERSALIKEVYESFFSENALNPTAFPSLRQFEAEVVGMTAALFHGGEEAVGSMTTGGTESILMAVKTAREWAAANKPEITAPEVVIPISAHPAFQKAFHYFGVKGITVPVGEDFKADLESVKAAIGPNTIMLVGSAPSYPHGIIDPIEEMSFLALEKGILMHVDACIGGYILPFARKLGYPIPAWDFSLEGVTSISADVHKYGYSAKGASVILYRNAELRKHQFFVYTEWSGGIYGSPTMTGTRPGGVIASAWAALKSIGMEGYLEMADATLKATKQIKAGIESIPGLKIIGEPQASLLAFASDEFDIFAVGDELNLRGWHFDRQQSPNSLHLTVSQIHRDKAEPFLADLRDAVNKVDRFRLAQVSTNLQVNAARALQKYLPSPVFQKLNDITSGKPKLKKGKTAAMYGMMGALAGTGDLQTIVLNFLDKMNSLEYSEA